MIFNYSHIRHHVYYVHGVTLGDYKKKYMLNANTANKGIQNQKDKLEDENKKTMKRSRKSQNNDKSPGNSKDENKTAMKKRKKSQNNDESLDNSKDENKTAIKRRKKGQNHDESPEHSEDENKTPMKRRRKSQNNDGCPDNSEDENKTATKRSRKSENNDECSNINTSTGFKGSCIEGQRFITDDIRDMRKIKCKLCGEIVLGYFMDSHLNFKHKVSRQKYGSFEYINNNSYYRSVREPCILVFKETHNFK